MNDISPILLKSVEGYFDMWFYADKQIKQIYEKVRNGTATYAEAKLFAEKAGGILSRAIEAAFSGNLPNDTIYQNIAEKVLTPMLEQNYNLISEVSEFIQEDLNKRAGIGLKAVKPGFNKDRAKGLAFELANGGTAQITKTKVEAQIINNALSIVDEFVEVNLNFHNEVGLHPKITRITNGKACEYCKERAYSGEYKGPDMPAEIFHRHRDCRCTILYDGQNGIEDVFGKNTYKDYQTAVMKQREYLVNLDKMTPAERRQARNARARERRRAGYSDSEWAERKAMQAEIAERVRNQGLMY